MRKTYFLIFLLLITTEKLNATGIKSLDTELGFSTYHYSYKEPGLMQQKGNMFGIDTAINLKTWFGTNNQEQDDALQEVFTKLEWGFSRGKVNYRSNETGDINGQVNTKMEGRLLVGVTNLISPEISPYGGLGYRRLKNDGKETISTTGHYGYERISNYLYLPLGLNWEITKTANRRMEAKIEYDLFLKGKQTSDLSYLDLYKSESKQHSGYGLKSSLRFISSMNDRTEFITEPFINYWNIKNSDPDQYYLFYEPQNNTLEIGLKFSMLFS